MQQPWMARVSFDEEEDAYVGVLDGASTVFWDNEELVGNDRLVDLIAERAEEVRQDFDARELVRASIEPDLQQMELQPTLPRDLSAVDVVRDALGMAALDPERELTPFQQRALAVRDHIRAEELRVRGVHLQVLGPDIQGISRKILGIPDGFDDRAVYLLYVQLADEAEQAIVFPEELGVRRTAYDRPGLLKVYYTVGDA
nr:hypothetical protein [Myxococcales bacterium]